MSNLYMDLASAITISSVTTSTSMLTLWAINKWLKFRMRNRVRAILLLKGCSSVAKKHTSSNPNRLFVDLDSMLQQHAKYIEWKDSPAHICLLYPFVKENVKQILQNYPHGKVILVSRNYEMLKLMPVLKKNLYFFAYSKEMSANTSLLYEGDESERTKDELLKLRLAAEFPVQENIVICQSLADLDQKIREKFGIQQLNL